MNISYVALEVASISDPERRESVEFLLDSSVMLTVLPAALLERLGVQPYSEHVISLPNGQITTRRKGIVQFRLGHRLGGGDVLFGEPGDANLLGVLTLQSLGLGLNPLRRELIELPMMMA